MKRNTLVNICGASRSGSTMLDLMLGNADNAFSCGEVYAWFRPTRTHHYKIKCSCSADECTYWQKIKDFKENEFHGKVFSQLKVNYVIDSSKDLVWVINNNLWYKNSNIDVVNIVIWKNPEQFAYSIWKREKNLTSWRNRYVRYYSRFIKAGIPFVSINYDELVQNPSGKLQKLCEIINMKYLNGKERFWEKQHHHLFGSLGTRRQIESKQSTIYRGVRYSKEFTNNLESLKEMIMSDKDLQRILKNLQEREVSKINKISYGNEIRKQIIYPAWYYMHKTIQWYRKYFPQEWPYDQ